MKNIFYTSAFLLLVISSSAFSQDQIQQIPAMVPGRTLDMAPVKSYTDSEEFAKAFEEFYPLVKPAKSVREEAEKYYQNISRAFKMQGIDSAEGAKVAFKGLEDNAFEKVYFDMYRRNLSAKELKKYTEFIKTPEGKHITEVWPNLQRTSSETMMYVAKTVNLNLTPLREAGREKMEKEHPPLKNGMLAPPLMPPSQGIINTPGMANPGMNNPGITNRNTMVPKDTAAKPVVKKHKK